MNELDKIFEKLLSEMTEIETAIWYTAGATTAYDMEKAAADLARITEERDAYRKGYEAAQVFAERLRREDRVKYFIGGHDVVLSLIEYAAALKQSS